MRISNSFFLRILLPVTFGVGPGYAYAGAVGHVQGTAGNLDTTFGANGVTVTSVPGINASVNSILLQNDGKILVFVGSAAVLRYTTAGALDTNFGDKGIVFLSTPIDGSLALQSNGQILIGGVVTAGGAALGAARLNPDGTPDASFGSGGVGIVSLGNRAPNVGTALLAQPNGDVVVCSTLISVGRGQPYQTAIARFQASGALDASFGNQGLSIQTGVSGCSALALLSNGGYLVVNAQVAAEFSAEGVALSTTTGATVVATSQTSAAPVPSIVDFNGDYLFGTALFVGEESRSHNSSAEVLGFTQNGAEVFDSTFHYAGAGGSGIQASVQGLAVQADGHVAAVGDQITFSPSGIVTVNGLARLTPTGGLDPTFGNGGTVVNSLGADAAVLVQPDGNIVTAGFGTSNSSLTLVRYLGQ
jgi:uncharacterized delta-60 repeat protein